MIYSRQRELLMDMLTAHPVHPTADELYSFLRAELPDVSISIATIYRNLNQLVECGRIMRIPVPGGADRFDPVNDGHYHMVCERCGNIEDIPVAAIPDVCAAAKASTGLDVRSEKLLFYGVCNACGH